LIYKCFLYKLTINRTLKKIVGVLVKKTKIGFGSKFLYEIADSLRDIANASFRPEYQEVRDILLVHLKAAVMLFEELLITGHTEEEAASEARKFLNTVPPPCPPKARTRSGKLLEGEEVVRGLLSEEDPIVKLYENPLCINIRSDGGRKICELRVERKSPLPLYKLTLRIPSNLRESDKAVMKYLARLF
jgi:hypothetical protein